MAITLYFYKSSVATDDYDKFRRRENIGKKSNAIHNTLLAFQICGILKRQLWVMFCIIGIQFFNGYDNYCFLFIRHFIELLVLGYHYYFFLHDICAAFTNWRQYIGSVNFVLVNILFYRILFQYILQLLV